MNIWEDVEDLNTRQDYKLSYHALSFIVSKTEVTDNTQCWQAVRENRRWYEISAVVTLRQLSHMTTWYVLYS